MKSWIIILFMFFPLQALAQKEDFILINGAGATFPYILYSKWFYEYSKINSSARINYRSIGSGGGVRQLLKNTLDFGASDVPMSVEELKKSKTPVIHIPTTLSAVVLTYNLPSLKKPLRLNSQLIAGVFAGVIQKWNDPRILALNPDENFPDQDIMVVYRADGSGTTAVFTEYLSKTQPSTLEKIGKGKSVPWPVGVGGKGNEGVLALVKSTPGAFAYLGMSYALNRKLPVAAVQNKAGKFSVPEIDSVQRAAQGVSDYTRSIVDPEESLAYPISSFTYLLIHQTMPAKKGRVMVDFLKWALGEGQKYSQPLFYIPLPQTVVRQALLEIDKIKLMQE